MVHVKVFAGISKKVDEREVVEPASVIDNRGAVSTTTIEIDKATELTSKSFKISVKYLCREKLTFARLPRWVTDHAGSTPRNQHWSMAGELEPPQSEKKKKIPDVKRVGGWIKTRVERDRRSIQEAP
jgi:hypothetical protein